MDGDTGSTGHLRLMYGLELISTPQGFMLRTATGVQLPVTLAWDAFQFSSAWLNSIQRSQYNENLKTSQTHQFGLENPLEESSQLSLPLSPPLSPMENTKS